MLINSMWLFAEHVCQLLVTKKILYFIICVCVDLISELYVRRHELKNYFALCRDDDDDHSDDSDDQFAITSRQKDLERRKMEETILAAGEGLSTWSSSESCVVCYYLFSVLQCVKWTCNTCSFYLSFKDCFNPTGSMTSCLLHH
jgi:hypothetical protein